MNRDVDFELRTYCAVWTERALCLIDLAKGRAINMSTLAALRGHGLAEREPARGLTDYGRGVLLLASLILEGSFIPPASGLSAEMQERLRGLELRGLYRLESCQAHKLKAVHLKALRSLVLRPGQAWNTLELVYGRYILVELRRAEFVTSAGTRKHDQVFPTSKADAFMAFLCGAADGAAVGE